MVIFIYNIFNEKVVRQDGGSRTIHKEGKRAECKRVKGQKGRGDCVKLQIQDDHNRYLLMKQDRLVLLAGDAASEPHSHVAAQLVFALGGVMLCTVAGERVRVRGICIREGEKHTIATPIGLQLTLLMDPESRLYQILSENYLCGRAYCVLPDRMIQDMQVFYRHCGANVEKLDQFAESLIERYGRTQTDAQEIRERQRSRQEGLCMTGKEYSLLEKMRCFYGQLGQTESIVQACVNAGFRSPSGFASACRRVFGISVHDLLTGQRGCDIEVELPEEESGEA